MNDVLVASTNLIGATSAEPDPRNRKETFDFMRSNAPEIVIDAAARVGGIYANDTFSADILSDNLQMQVNVMCAANEISVDRLLSLGSSCSYPKLAPQPIRESSLMTGELESTNEAYAIAKIVGTLLVQSYRKQYGRHWISAMPTNLYGPGDNFHLQNTHVLPALVRRLHEAKEADADEGVIWGSGRSRREFMFVEDFAKACLFLLDYHDSAQAIKVGVGTDMPIRDLARQAAETVGFRGKLTQDATKPDRNP